MTKEKEDSKGEAVSKGNMTLEMNIFNICKQPGDENDLQEVVMRTSLETPARTYYVFQMDQ